MIGKTISHYKILEKLGEGGMGVVYKAEDSKLKRFVALKFLPPDVTRDPEAKQRFVHEAQAASALQHNNICTIHEIDETDDGQMFICMDYYQGETLKEKIKQGPFRIDESVNITVQIARGLEKAHQKGIIHRDIKPANVLITEEGVVKLLDFGVAKLTGQTKLTKEGTTLGTVAYMSPEQIRGEQTSEKTDIWSLGVVLYEMLTGEVPFKGDYEQAVTYSILNENPKPIRKLSPVIDKELENIVLHTLYKDSEKRYNSCGELVKVIENYWDRQTSRESSGRVRFYKKPVFIIPGICILLGISFWIIRSIVISKKVKWAHEQGLPEISRLVEEGDYISAFRLAGEIERYIPGNPLLEQLQPEFSRFISIRVIPEGAEIFMKEYGNVEGDWEKLGISPIDSVWIPRSYFRWKIEKEGYQTIIASSNGSLNNLKNNDGDIILFKKGEYPADMVFVPGKQHMLRMPGLEHLSTELDDYLIDKYEVTNKKYKEFVDSGGYQKREYWKLPFKKGERTLSWEEAMGEFKDKTGYPGPATWEVGDYPDGQDDYPVCGVSWYEAMAYSEFSGKSLPTVYHWNKIASTRESSHIIPLSNINGKANAPVCTYQAIGYFETYDIAGNVREWCYNQRDQERFILGGGWDDQYWAFQDIYSQPPFDRSPTNGFRCMKYLTTPKTQDRLNAAIDRPHRDFRSEKPVSDQVYIIYRSMYDYDKKELQTEIISQEEDSLKGYRIEKVSFDAAYGNERVMAYLFLPLRQKPPFQTAVYFPGSSTIHMRSSDDLNISVVEFLIKSGRALMYPIYKSTYERGDGFLTDQPSMTSAYKEHVIMWVKDLRRSIDYLETREDIVSDKLAFFGHSWGARMGGLILAVEPRLKTAILLVGGLKFQRCYPEVEMFNFISRITIPVLMLNGKYDSWFPLETSQKPMFDLLGTPPEHKKHIVFETGHGVPRDIRIKEGLAWLDKYLGTVK
jgi:serine/threonine protein kinase/dienelactone hydrolase